MGRINSTVFDDDTRWPVGSPIRQDGVEYSLCHTKGASYVCSKHFWSENFIDHLVSSGS
jgi:hypothetical protein